MILGYFGQAASRNWTRRAEANRSCAARANAPCVLWRKAETHVLLLQMTIRGVSGLDRSCCRDYTDPEQTPRVLDHGSAAQEGSHARLRVPLPGLQPSFQFPGP
jgi:hypothetical protein